MPEISGASSVLSASRDINLTARERRPDESRQAATAVQATPSASATPPSTPPAAATARPVAPTTDTANTGTLPREPVTTPTEPAARPAPNARANAPEPAPAAPAQQQVVDAVDAQLQSARVDQARSRFQAAPPAAEPVSRETPPPPPPAADSGSARTVTLASSGPTAEEGLGIN